MEFSKIEKDILWKLCRKRCFGRGHMLIDNVLRGFPPKDLFRDTIHNLITKNILIAKKTKHGKGIYINTKLRVEIIKALKEEYDFV